MTPITIGTLGRWCPSTLQLAVRWVLAAHLVAPLTFAQEGREVAASQGGGTESSRSEAAPAGIVPPRLVHFESAPYPTDAEKAGLDAVVGLQIVIDANGQVTSVEVREPAGYGFDEAAALAARSFVFEPARRGGVPVAAKVLFRYRFAFEAAKVPNQAATPVTKPRVGELTGRIVAGSPPTPLAGIVLRVRAQDDEAITVATAADGRWTVPNLPPGDYVVDVAVSGYRRVVQIESVRAGTVTAIKYSLEFTDELPIEITVRGAALQREVTQYELPREELLRVPGTLGDAIHGVEALPSVARPRGLSGNLMVRGSAPEDTQVYVEGTLVPHVFHYGSLSSVVPSEMVERIELYPGNFSVRYGRGMGGVVEVRLRETNPDRKLHGSAQIDLINTRLNAEGPVPRMRDWSFMGGFRTSYLDRWLVPLLRSRNSAKDAMPRYHDYQLYLQRRLPNNGLYRIGFIGAHDTFVPIENDPSWRSSSDSFGHLQSQLRWPLSSTLELKANWSLGRTRSKDADDDVRSYQTTESLGLLRSELAIKTGGFGVARLGTDLSYSPFTVEALTDQQSEGGALSTESLDSPQLSRYQIHGTIFRPAAWMEYELAPSPRINVTAGTRVDYAKDTRQLDIAPRLAVRTVLIQAPISTVLKGGVGLFYQPPRPEETVAELGTVGLTSSRAVHSMLGFEQTLSRQTTLSVEGFWKEMRALLVERTDGSGRSITENRGRGRALGTELLLRYRSDDRFFGWIAYTLSRSTRTKAPGEPEQLYRYDQTHVLNVLGSYRLGHGWEIGGRFRAMTGFPYRDCVGGLFDNSTGAYRCYGNPKQKRLAPYHQLDLRIEKDWELRSFRLALYMDIINVYNHNSPDEAVPNYDYSGTKPLSLSLPLIPSLGIRGEM